MRDQLWDAVMSSMEEYFSVMVINAGRDSGYCPLPGIELSKSTLGQ